MNRGRRRPIGENKTRIVKLVVQNGVIVQNVEHEGEEGRRGEGQFVRIQHMQEGGKENTAANKHRH